MLLASSSLARGTSMRVSAVQVWPELRKHVADAVGDGLLEVGVVEDDVGRLAAELEGDPLDRLRRRARRTRLPARVEPVNDTMSTSGWAAMASPTTGPAPVTRLNTPGGQARPRR